MKNTNFIYAFGFFRMFYVIMPVLVPFYLDRGATMAQVFQIQATFGLTAALLEIPSGYLCDLWGRKWTLTLGAFIAALGYSWLNFADSLLDLYLYQFILGIGASLVSGADISLLYDSLAKSDPSKSAGTKAMGILQMVNRSAESFGGILGSYLATISFSSVVLLHSFTAWLPVIVSLFIFEPDRKLMNKRTHRDNFAKIFKHLLTDNRTLTLIFINFIVWGLSTFIIAWVFQKHWMDSKIGIGQFGLLWAGYNMVIGITARAAHPLEERFGQTPLLMAMAWFSIAGYFGVSFFYGALGIFFGLFVQVARGLNQVVTRDALNARTPSEFRATVNSISSFCFRFGFAIIGPVVGWSIDYFGLSSSLQGLGFIFMLMFFALLMPLVRRLKDETQYEMT